MAGLKRGVAIGLLSALLLTLGACKNYGLPETRQTETPVQTASLGIADLPDKPVRDTVFTLSYEASKSLNPYQTDSEKNYMLSGLMYETLFRLNDDFTFEPLLCASWRTDTGYVIELEPKAGVKFHDGSEMTLFDIIYSINLARESERFGARLSRIMDVYADGGMVCIALSLPNRSFPALLDIPIVKEGTGYDAVPQGTGPYCFSQADKTAFLKVSETYRDAASLPIGRFYLKEYSDETIIDAFESELVDLATANKSDERYLEFGGDCEIRYANSTVLHYLGFNDERGFCASPLRRIIINSAIDRTTITDSLVGGTVPTYLPINPASPYYLEDVAKLTHVAPDKLSEFMVRSFVEDYDKDGKLEYLESNAVHEFVLEFIVNKENPQKVAAARNIAESLEALGMQVDFQALSWSDYLNALANREYDIFYGEVRLTADFDLTQLLGYGGSVNYGAYDEKLDSLILAFNEADEAAKPAAAKALFMQFADSAVIAPVLFEKLSVYTHRGVVTNMTPTEHNVFDHVTAWTINLDRNS